MKHNHRKLPEGLKWEQNQMRGIWWVLRNRDGYPVASINLSYSHKTTGGNWFATAVLDDVVYAPIYNNSGGAPRNSTGITYARADVRENNVQDIVVDAVLARPDLLAKLYRTPAAK